MASLDKMRSAFIVLLVMAFFTLAMFRIMQNSEYSNHKLQAAVLRAVSFVEKEAEQALAFVQKEAVASIPHVHLFSNWYGHTGEITPGGTAAVHYANDSMIDMTKTVAIGCAVTSRGRHMKNRTAVVKGFPIFSEFLPTFCKTASQGYDYHFYFSFDFNDAYFGDTSNLAEFQQYFDKQKCPSLNVTLHFVQCNHSGSPAWAQNDAMMEAYIDNMEYFYRINDDSVLMSENWTTIFINRLMQFDPPNVGVVGPKHSGGNTHILTYDFVHKTHVDVFGFYYHRMFTTWYGDKWITEIYKYADGRCQKMPEVRVRHTMSGGTRYKIHAGTGKHLKELIPEGAAIIKRYANMIKSQQNTSGNNNDNEVQVISMSLSGKDQTDTYGAIRNCQIRMLDFPKWTIRIYMEDPDDAKLGAVPVRIINKLRTLGAKIVYIHTSLSEVPPDLWPLLVVDDESVHRFIVRRPRSRLSALDARLVDIWLGTKNILHCIRDHPSHVNRAIVEYLWGARSVDLRKNLGTTMAATLAQNKNKSPSEFMSTLIWPMVKDVAICHDAVACMSWEQAKPMPVKNRTNTSYLGQAIDAYGQPLINNRVIDEFPLKSVVQECQEQ